MDEDFIGRVFDNIKEYTDEKTKRLLAASFAKELGRGGKAKVQRATGLAKDTILKGVRELEMGEVVREKIRRDGAGRTSHLEKYPNLVKELERLIEPTTKGDPMSPLKWTLKSTRNLSAALKKKNFNVSHESVASILKELGYSLQANLKAFENTNYENRDRQFRYINKVSQKFLDAGEPVISVDTKKKELIGHYKNNGQEWAPQGTPEKVKMHDFVDPELGKAIPYGIYDIAKNEALVNVGVDHDTAAFAVESIRTWWQSMGQITYPEAAHLLINADSGGSNGYRNKLWKQELQKLSNETGLQITVTHLPPGTSKWNKIEHRLFCHITMNWRAKPLVNHETIINLISSTTTNKGLTVKSKLDLQKYATGIFVSDKEIGSLNLKRRKLLPNWNYTISPQKDNMLSEDVIS